MKKLKVLTLQHRIRTRVLLVESPKLYPWVIALLKAKRLRTTDTETHNFRLHPLGYGMHLFEAHLKSPAAHETLHSRRYFLGGKEFHDKSRRFSEISDRIGMYSGRMSEQWKKSVEQVYLLARMVHRFIMAGFTVFFSKFNIYIYQIKQNRSSRSGFLDKCFTYL